MKREITMNPLDRLIAYISPRTALKRHAARMMVNSLGGYGRRSFDAVSGGRLRSDWTNITRDADAANVTSLSALRNNVRDLTRNSGIVAGPLRRITNNVIGVGIRPQARVKEDGPYDIGGDDPLSAITKDTAERFNYNVEKLWRSWSSKSDAALQMNFYEQQGLAFRGMLGDGESLVICRSSQNKSRPLPLCLEVCEIDRLSTPPGEMSNPKIRNGVEFDTEGVPIRYYILKKHPGSSVITGKDINDYEQVDAFAENGNRNVLHLYDILRPGQSRGYTPFAAGLKDIQDLDRYLEAEVVGARIAACLAAFVQSPADYSMYSSLSSNETAQKIREFEPGMIEYLRPGEEVNVFSSNRPNNAFSNFIRQMMMNIANAVDIPYEVFTNDWANLNYSNARTVLLQAYLAFRIYQLYVINHFCIPVWENFITDGLISGKIEAPGFDRRRDDYLRCAWIPPGWAWVDPVKEATGKQLEVNNLFETLSDICASKGKDFEETIETRAMEMKKIKDVEKKYGVKLQPEKSPPPVAGDDKGKGKDKEETEDAE